MPSVFIDGAAGTTGLDIRERLNDRDEFDLLVLPDALRKDTDARREALNSVDFAILCLPDDAAREAVALIEPDSKTRVIDASSAYRVADRWTYGFPELTGAERIEAARRVSNPGCYPTGFLALVAPLVRAGLLPADHGFCVNAVSGYSGGGNALIERFDREPDIAFRTYGLDLAHKHCPEMQRHAGLSYPPVFSPSVVPALRGMIVDIPLNRAAMARCASPDSLREALRRAYENDPLVSVQPAAQHPAELLLLRDAPHNDGITLWVFANADDSQLRLVARLDNLGKGASGQAVQNLNIMSGLPATQGLHLPEF